MEKNERGIKFILDDSNPQFANALRRIILSGIPILAVEYVDFTANDSALYNEVIAHRMALIPLVFDSKDFNLKSECKCEGKGCSQCEVVFAIDKKGPTVVYSKDMKSSNKDVKPLYDNIPVVELQEGQKLKLEATAILGFGRNHAKWQAAKSFYNYHPDTDSKNPTKFIFDVESISGLNADKIVLLAVDILKQKSKDFQKALEKL